MKNFEERKKEYLELLEREKKVTEVVKKTIIKTYSDYDSKIEMFLDPKDERELKIVSLLFEFTKDSDDLSERIKYREVEEIPYGNSRGVKKLIKILASISIGKIDFYLIDKKLPPKERAEEIYQFMVCLADGEKIVNYVAGAFGLDMDNEKDAFLSMGLWMHLILALDNREIETDDFEKYTDEEILDYEEFTNAFHTLCEQGKKEKNIAARLASTISEADFAGLDNLTLDDNQDTDSHSMGK